MLGTGSLKSIFDHGFIKIYSGTEPATADAAATGTLLCTISVASSGTGITFDAPAAGVLPKAAAEAWSGVNSASGIAAYFRHVTPSDDGTASTTQARMQGTVAVAGAEVNLSSVNLTATAPQTLDAYNVALPTY